MKQKRPKYHSYLIRLWRSTDDEQAQWHVMLVNPHNGKRHSFASLEGMKLFLDQLLAGSDLDESSSKNK